MQEIILIENPLESEHEKFYVEDVREFLKEKYPEFPSTAKIYHELVSVENDVTPTSKEEVDKLATLQGRLYIIIYPGDPVSIIVTVVMTIISYLLTPKPPSPPVVSRRNIQEASPNNELSDRTNKARPNERIPDIVGKVRSTPDLLAVPYQIFENNREVEVAFMCIGRGYYDVDDIKDGDTKISEIAGSTVAVYDPYTSPNSGDAPSVIVGTAIDDGILNVRKSNSVNGQLLRAPNSSTFQGASNVFFRYPDEIVAVSGSGVDFTEFFESDDTLNITDGDYTDGVTTVDLDGNYTILSVTSDIITLANPNAINNDWADIGAFVGDKTGITSARLESSGDRWIGPFTIEGKEVKKIFSNFVCPNGLYKDDGNAQVSMEVEVELGVTPLDSNGTPTGAEELFTGTLIGSAVNRDQKAITLKASPTFTGKCSVRARRVTTTDLDFNGTVVDDVKWRDLYGVSPILTPDFGNITTVHSQTYATSGALSVKDRKINMLATRKIPTRISGSNFTTSLTATKSVDEIISFLCLDPYIGNRKVAEIDFNSIYNTVANIKAYFGTDEAAEFSYTFDNNNLSFEETVDSVAKAVYSVAYRQGNVIKLDFEKATEDSVLLFNHRNKIPSTETRTVRFGNEKDYDGMELQYVDPEDDSIASFFIPEDRSAVNSKIVETIGIRNKFQAFVHAWREWGKIKHQNIAVEFEATQEAAALVRSNRILVADNTRPDTLDGEILAQNGLTLSLSQKVELENGLDYLIYLQHKDGTVEIIPITAGLNNKSVVLAYAPALPLVTDYEKYARSVYTIMSEDSDRVLAFLVQEKDPKENMTFLVNAVNYSPLIYIQDQLLAWLVDSVDDKSPYYRTSTLSGSVYTNVDSERGDVLYFDGYLQLSNLTAKADYTKTAWIKKEDFSTVGHIISSSVSNHERFYVDAGGVLKASHGAGEVDYQINTAGWIHVAVSYSAADTTMILYVNGVEVDRNESVAQRTLAGLHFGALAGANKFIGSVDDARLYSRALNAQEIRQLYKTTLT
ncbi:LamG domain-containing protein [Candidatus Dependentiae bacterium]|nr:MAG: LamG domain-containing protein [Candidatus Dependentiae bacterium]